MACRDELYSSYVGPFPREKMVLNIDLMTEPQKVQEQPEKENSILKSYLESGYS